MDATEGSRREGMDRRIALTLMAGAAVALNAGGRSTAQAQAQTQPQTLPPQAYATDIRTELKQLTPTVYAYLQREAPGQTNFSVSNCGIVVGADSLLAIDTTAAPIQGKKFLAAGQAATGKKFKRVVITHHHGDHIGGIPFFEGADVIAQEECRVLMAKQVSASKPTSWAKREGWADGTEDYKAILPNQTYSRKMNLFDYADTPVEFFHPNRAHTVGDTIVHLPQQKIMFLGDIGFFGVTPANGNGYVAGWIRVCDQILKMDVQTIVPGHGPVGGKAELADMRDYLILVQAEAKKRFDRGISPGRAAAEIDLGKYKTWTDADRIPVTVARLYSEFAGTITPDADREAVTKARLEYVALTQRG